MGFLIPGSRVRISAGVLQFFTRAATGGHGRNRFPSPVSITRAALARDFATPGPAVDTPASCVDGRCCRPSASGRRAAWPRAECRTPRAVRSSSLTAKVRALRRLGRSANAGGALRPFSACDATFAACRAGGGGEAGPNRGAAEDASGRLHRRERPEGLGQRPDAGLGAALRGSVRDGGGNKAGVASVPKACPTA